MAGCSGEVREGPCLSPALVGLDLLLDVLPVGALGSLLGHSHQLDQLGPGCGGWGESRGGCRPWQQPHWGLPTPP